MQLYDRIKELIRKQRGIAIELYIKSRDSGFKISDSSFKWLVENKYVFNGKIRANVLDFFRNKVEMEGETLLLKPA